MIAPEEFLSIVVSVAVLMAAMSPILLILLFVRDWRRGSQW